MIGKYGPPPVDLGQLTQLAGDVVPYSRPYSLPELKAPVDILRLLHPYWFVPSGGGSIKDFIDRPANTNKRSLLELNTGEYKGQT